MDLLPELTLPLPELQERLKARAEAVLAAGGADLAALGGAWWADILFVTGKARGDLSEAQRDALAKATAALGYNPVQSALLCAAKEPLTSEALRVYLDALGVRTLVFLESSAVPAAATLTVAEAYPYTHVVTVTDFFGSLDKLPQKRKAWQELKQATKPQALH